MIKNGKNIKCKVCKKEFYISGSRVGVKKYCSRDCAKRDDYGFKKKEKKCIICGGCFTIKNNIEVQKKTCSDKCLIENRRIISKERSLKKSIKICKVCGKKYEALTFHIGTGKCLDCRMRQLSGERTGVGNPNYKDGHATKEKFGGRRSIYTSMHMRACQKYRKEFIKKNEYLFCENCGINKNGASWFEVHHIYFASRFPRHQELHNFKNLILLCKKCHTGFHGGDKFKEKFLKLEKVRGLKKLFNTKI